MRTRPGHVIRLGTTFQRWPRWRRRRCWAFWRRRRCGSSPTRSSKFACTRRARENAPARAREKQREGERGREGQREREERQEPSAWTLAVLEKTVFFLLKKSAGVWRVLSFASPRARARLATRLPMPPPWRKHRVGAHRLQTVQENRTRSLQAISTQQDQCTTTAKDAPGPSPDTPA